jgi:hypothetical protein
METKGAMEPRQLAPAGVLDRARIAEAPDLVRTTLELP